jgi:limonene-1,2-epoxide hydrolase
MNTDALPSPSAVVDAFIAAWNRGDLTAVVNLLAQDVVYHNVPMDPIMGRPAVAAYLTEAGPFRDVDWTVVHQASHGTIVLNERVDRFTKNGKPISLPVMGRFDVRDGQIYVWRDYFDLTSYRAQFGE